jgi:hypothetical protein
MVLSATDGGKLSEASALFFGTCRELPRRIQ